MLGLFSPAPSPAQPVIATPLHGFNDSPDGYNAVGSLIFGNDNALYGTTYIGGTNASSPGGTIFKLGRDGTGYTVLRSFSTADTGNYGSVPRLMGLSIAPGGDGTLYGTTYYGGTNDSGTVFRMGSDGNGFTVLHNFSASDYGPLNVMQANNGSLYGAGYGVIFKLDTNGDNYSILHAYTNVSVVNGCHGKLVQGSDGALYGVAAENGTNNGGTIFKFGLDGGGFTVLHNFPSVAGDGSLPYTGLVQGGDGALYGTTETGGTNGYGTVFKIGTNGSGYQVLHNFTGEPDGRTPESSLVVGPANVLYGTTYYGGTNNTGAVFILHSDGSGYKVLYDFAISTPSIGRWPLGGLVQGPASAGGGVFYGTTLSDYSFTGGYVYAMLVNPPLSINPVVNQTGSNQVLVSWPAWALNYILQTTTNLGSPNWITASNGVPMASVLLTNGLPGAYYRLAWPQ
jgi:uncharacterized repeat protein (TIGR03803 family)